MLAAFHQDLLAMVHGQQVLMKSWFFLDFEQT